MEKHVFYPSSRIHKPASGLKPGVSTSNQSTDSSWTGLELPICHGFCLSGGTGESDLFDASLLFFVFVAKGKHLEPRADWKRKDKKCRCSSSRWLIIRWFLQTSHINLS